MCLDECKAALSELLELKSSHTSLSKDHKSLQELHEDLSSEYDSLLAELHRAKDTENQLKLEVKTNLDRLNMLRREASSAHIVQEEQRSGAQAAEKAERWRREREELLAVKDKVEQDLRMLMVEHKTLKREYNELHLKYTQQSGDLVECRDQLNSMDVEVAKMANKCEVGFLFCISLSFLSGLCSCFPLCRPSTC